MPVKFRLARVAYCLAVAAGGGITGFAACIAAGLSLKWVVVALLGLVLVLAFCAAKEKRRFTLAFFILTIPVFVAKKIYSSDYPLVTGGPSALGLFLYDIPLMMLMAHVVLSKVLNRDSSLVLSPVFKPFLLYILWSVVSILNASEPSLALIEVAWLAKMALILLVMVNVIEDRRDVVLVLSMLILGLFIQEAVTFLQAYLKVWFTFTGDTEQTTLRGSGEADLFRAGGTIGPHNVQSAYYVLVVPLAAAICLVVRSRWQKVALSASVLGGVLAVLLTYSRNGYLSLVVALAVLVALARAKGVLTSRMLVIGVCLFLVLSNLIIIVKGGSFLERIKSSAAIEPRIESIKIAFNMIKAHPILGVGLNNFSLVMQDRAYSPEGISSLQQTYFGGDFFGTVVHNRYLLVASQMGLTGLLCYCWFLVRTFRYSFLISRVRDPFYAAIGAGILSALSGALVQMLSDIYNSDLLVTVFTVLVGLLFAVHRLNRQAAEPLL